MHPSPAPPAPATLANTLRLSFGDIAVESRIAVPAGRMHAEAVLPALQGLVNDVVAAGERRQVAAGRSISCRKGCGACCRQLVPISPVEAGAIGELVRRLPSARGREIRSRFEAAERQLAAAGLADMLLQPELRSGVEDRTLSLRYFALAIACPFLEDEACSIHDQRPLACREYLVTSPASHCAHPEQRGVVPVPIPKLSVAARGLDADDRITDTSARWLPLSLALAGRRAGPPTGARRTGPDWIRRFLARLRVPAGRGTT